MKPRTLAAIGTFAMLFAATVFSQELVPTKDPGVNRAALIINPGKGVDVLRLELEPGKARTLHQHDDVRYHLFLSLSGSIEVTMGDKKVATTPGQALMIEKSVPHSYRNTGTTPAACYEVFIREPKNDR